MPRYATRQDAIDFAIAPALTEGTYDLEAICPEAFEWRIDTNAAGQELLTTGGFEQTVTDDQFWVIVARNETPRRSVVTSLAVDVVDATQS